MTQAEDKTNSLLAALWLRLRPVVEERLVLLERVSAAAAAGSLTQPLLIAAQGSAHKLAGSLGMYGYDEGTRVAREIEVLLESDALDAARLSMLIGELRTAIFPAG